MSERDYYCSMKFRFLKIDLERNNYYNCHAAAPHDIDTEWLSNNPGQLFNTEINVEEREMMLNNQRNKSCEQNCWPAEDAGGISPRLSQKGNIKTHLVTKIFPEIVDLTTNSDCNLTCSYCFKGYSSQWQRDISTNGKYEITGIDHRYDQDKEVTLLSQDEKKNTLHAQLLLKELSTWKDSLKRIVITGGEPFLNKFLLEIVESAKTVPLIEIYTGLGVNETRFLKILYKLSSYKNVSIIVSAEGIDKFLEFNRYGIKWDEFKKKIFLLKDSNIDFRFQSTISNITLFGFSEFHDIFWRHTGKRPNILSFAYQPDMMAPYVMDTDSKKLIIDLIAQLPETIAGQIYKSIQQEPTELQRLQIGQFLTQFVSRRPDLSLDIFPSSFLTWAGL